VQRFARAGDHVGCAGGVAKRQFDIKQICIGVCCEHVLDHHGDLADIARAIGEQESVSLVGGEWHDDRSFGGAVPRRPSSAAALAD
jgi:hypothetical protein